MANEVSLRDLKHYEQQVNDRHLTSSAPAIDSKLLPESAASIPLAWKKTARDSVRTYSTLECAAMPVLPELADGTHVLIPVHPLSEYRFGRDELVYSGRIQFSASYRTVFFEPETGGVLSGWVPEGKTLMLKLSLEEPLPGIPGDRSLPEKKIEKCIKLSDALPTELEHELLADQLEVVPEFFGVSSDKCSVIMRLLPDSGLLPFFSLYSSDRKRPEQWPFIVHQLQKMYRNDSTAIAESLGEELAGPLVRSMVAGFRRGFSMEMHAQNTLFAPGKDRLIDRVYFRDLEGVVFSNRMRAQLGLNPLFEGSGNEELIWTGGSMRRWFNRNVDHDIGRIFRGAIDALTEHGALTAHDRNAAVRSIRIAIRRAVQAAELGSVNWPGRVFPYSRAPWGSGLRPGDYFRTTFR